MGNENQTPPAETDELAILRAKSRHLRAESFRALTQAISVLSNCLAVSLVITQATGEIDEDGQGTAETQHFSVCNYGAELMIEHQGAGAELLFAEYEALMQQQQKAREAAAAAESPVDAPEA